MHRWPAPATRARVGTLLKFPAYPPCTGHRSYNTPVHYIAKKQISSNTGYSAALVPQAEITYHAKAGYRPRTVIVPDSDAILRRTGSPMRCRCRTRPAGSLALRLCSVLCAILYRQPQSSTLDIVIRKQT